MDYKIGDKVVYPNHGVGIVEQINYGVLNGRTERYYMIRIVSSGLRVMVPQSNAGTVGLRSVIRSNESTKVLARQRNGHCQEHHCRTGRGLGCKVSRQGQAAVPHHDGEI